MDYEYKLPDEAEYLTAEFGRLSISDKGGDSLFEYNTDKICNLDFQNELGEDFNAGPVRISLLNKENIETIISNVLQRNEAYKSAVKEDPFVEGFF